MKRYFALLNLIIWLFTMTACGDDGLRKAPYTSDEMEAYLEEKYQKDFVVLSRTEHYDSYFETLQMVEYEIQCEQDGEDTFTAIDQHDGGMAGWNVTDKYRSK